jgi:RNA polymerase sigma-70 factor (ECF subfamily)
VIADVHLVQKKAKQDSKATTTELLSLFKRLAKGEKEALAELYDRCGRIIYGLALWRTHSSADAADITQEVFVRIAERSSELTSVRNPLPYMLRIAHTLSADIHRRRKREALMSHHVVDEIAIDADPFAAYEISTLLSQLPESQREAIYLRYVVGSSFLELSKIMGVSIFTAASRCRLGLQKLKTLVKEKK